MTRFVSHGKMTRFVNLGAVSRARAMATATAAQEASTERIEVIDMFGGKEEEMLSPHDISLVRY